MDFSFTFESVIKGNQYGHSIIAWRDSVEDGNALCCVVAIDSDILLVTHL